MHDRGNLGPTPGIKGSFFTITYCWCSSQILDMYISKKLSLFLLDHVSGYDTIQLLLVFLNIDILLCGNYELIFP